MASTTGRLLTLLSAIALLGGVEVALAGPAAAASQCGAHPGTVDGRITAIAGCDHLASDEFVVAEADCSPGVVLFPYHVSGRPSKANSFASCLPGSALRHWGYSIAHGA